MLVTSIEGLFQHLCNQKLFHVQVRLHLSSLLLIISNTFCDFHSKFEAAFLSEHLHVT